MNHPNLPPFAGELCEAEHDQPANDNAPRIDWLFVLVWAAMLAGCLGFWAGLVAWAIN